MESGGAAAAAAISVKWSGSFLSFSLVMAKNARNICRR